MQIIFRYGRGNAKVSVLSGLSEKKTSRTRFIDTKTKADIFTTTKRSLNHCNEFKQKKPYAHLS